jgi:hypothetical protein
LSADAKDPGAPKTEPSSFQTNARGMTYGSAAGGGDVDPDLILATGDDGTTGYVLASDLNGPEPKSAEEAVAMTLAAQRGEMPTIPLYASDGVTKIGTFTFSSSVDTKPEK